MEYYEDIDKTNSVLSKYNNYKINYKRKRLKQDNMLSVVLTQLIIAVVLVFLVLALKFIPVFEPAFDGLKNFIKIDIFQDLYSTNGLISFGT